MSIGIDDRRNVLTFDLKRHLSDMGFGVEVYSDANRVVLMTIVFSYSDSETYPEPSRLLATMSFTEDITAMVVCNYQSETDEQSQQLMSVLTEWGSRNSVPWSSCRIPCWLNR